MEDSRKGSKLLCNFKYTPATLITHLTIASLKVYFSKHQLPKLCENLESHQISPASKTQALLIFLLLHNLPCSF